MEIGNLPEKGIRVMMIRMIKELGRKMYAESEKLDFNRKLPNIKNNKIKMKNAITEAKTSQEGISRRLNHTEEWISKLEDSSRITEAEQK